MFIILVFVKKNNFHAFFLYPFQIFLVFISTLGKYYQAPQNLHPLDADPGSNGKPSDHLMVTMTPINPINNKPPRKVREVRVRPITQSGLNKLSDWMKTQDWESVYIADAIDEKAKIFQDMLLYQADQC